MSFASDLATKGEELVAKRLAMKAMYDESKDLSGDAAAAKAEEIKRANLELADLGKVVEDLQGLVATERQNTEALKALTRQTDRMTIPEGERVDGEDDDVLAIGAKSVHTLVRDGLKAAGRKSIAEGGDGFRNFRGSLGELSLYGLKTLITSADMTPQGQRLSAIQPYLTEERTTVGELVLQGTTGAQKIEYFEETTFTNAAAAVAEGAAKPESALDFTLREDSVRKIATWIPVTDEMLADVPFFESYLRERLGFMVRQTEEAQLLNGDGVAPNIEGIMRRTGVQTVTGYGMSTLDSIYKAITEVRTDAFAEPTAMVVHPQDWFDIRTSKDTTGNYLLGPATAEGPTSVWGLQVRVTTAIAQNTGLVGAFRPHAQVFRRSGIDIAISTENEDYFIKNKLAVRAEERLALAVYRPSAFCKVEALVQGS